MHTPSQALQGNGGREGEGREKGGEGKGKEVGASGRGVLIRLQMKFEITTEL